MTTEIAAQSEAAARAERMCKFITALDANLATGGFSDVQRRSIIAIMMETEVELTPVGAQAAA